MLPDQKYHSAIKRKVTHREEGEAGNTWRLRQCRTDQTDASTAATWSRPPRPLTSHLNDTPPSSLGSSCPRLLPVCPPHDRERTEPQVRPCGTLLRCGGFPTEDPWEPRRPGCCHPRTCPHSPPSSSLSTFPPLNPLSSLRGLCCPWSIPGGLPPWGLSPPPGMLSAQVPHSDPFTTSGFFPPINTGC